MVQIQVLFLEEKDSTIKQQDSWLFSKNCLGSKSNRTSMCIYSTYNSKLKVAWNWYLSHYRKLDPEKTNFFLLWVWGIKFTIFITWEPINQYSIIKKVRKLQMGSEKNKIKMNFELNLTDSIHCFWCITINSATK